MPKNTFFNLPEAKRLLVENAAMDEFAVWGFDNASINRIVGEAKIAKGSFYQYFDDKKDLFKHLITRISESKLAYLSPILQNPQEYDFFTLVSELYRSGLAFAKDNPKAALVGNQVFISREHPVYREIISDGMESAKEVYENLLNTAIARGEVRLDINPRFISHVLLSMSIAIFEYYFDEVRKGDFNMTEIDDDIMETVKMTLDFIKHGITLNTEEFVPQKNM